MFYKIMVLVALAWCTAMGAIANDSIPLMPPQLSDTSAFDAKKRAELIKQQIKEFREHNHDDSTQMFTLPPSYNDSLVVIDDSVYKKNSEYWKWALVGGALDINDTAVAYPKLLGLGLKFYRWYSRTFNYYDTTYVKGSNKKWKFMFKNTNWIDFYSGTLDYRTVRLQMNSDITSLFGFQVSYTALSLGYMFNINNLLLGKKTMNRRLDFSFTGSRLYVEAYYSKNDMSPVNLFKLGKWHGSNEFWGLTRESYGFNAYYIFNHTHYAQAAAYSFSKYQRRSCGSMLGGIFLTHQDIYMDLGLLDEELQPYVPDAKVDYRFRYRDFGFILGYGYNWVFHDGWVLNITAAPSIGYRHSFPNSIEGKKTLLSTNVKGRLALVRNSEGLFYGINLTLNGFWYHSNIHSFFSSSNDLNITIGFRY